MSRLRRLFHSDRYFFVTSNLRQQPQRVAQTLRSAAFLRQEEFACLSRSIQATRESLKFLLTAWVFLPDHWHAIIYPRHPLTISRVMKEIKMRSTREINSLRGEDDRIWQGRFFERALRTVKEYQDCLAYIHSNPVKRGLVAKAEDWEWSSVYAHRGGTTPALPVDAVRLPSDMKARLY